MWMVASFCFSACSPSHRYEVDELNMKAYAFHYRNLDSTTFFAKKALALASNYEAGYAEACNNMAFVAMARMDYAGAKRWLSQVEKHSDSQLELLVADVQHMRLCQRESRNKDFYTYREKAILRLRRIEEEAGNLPKREQQRVVYARSEFYIVAATYFYYVGLEKPMLGALGEIDSEELEQDTAQYLNYLYNMGAGGAITQGTSQDISQSEFDYLMRCYLLASNQNPYPYWQAQSLQSLSEHLQKANTRNFLIKNNLPAIQYLNIEQMPDTLLAGNFAQRALNLFSEYGDVYQIAGAYRTLSECFWAIRDYVSAGDCLNHALSDNKAISQAPDLVASIREQLCLVYSAIDDKPRSDYNRNIYLDLQEQTRQDRQLEARAAILRNNSEQLNLMIGAVVVMIVLTIVLLYVFDRMRRRNNKKDSIEKLLEPLKEWEQCNKLRIKEIEERKADIEEAYNLCQVHILNNKKQNLEQRAKISLVNSITPFIDRMSNEVSRLVEGKEPESVRQERYQYISELTDKINQYNDILTQWIQMRQGNLHLRIESFALQPLFDIVRKGQLGFLQKGVLLEVEPTEAVVKADQTLTLFMINTIADNARKFTPSGGKVRISASEDGGYVEIVIADTGRGMSKEQLSHLFDRTYMGGHGFGLLNCKGIIDKYKKMSSLFRDCSIQAKSTEGSGSRFSFRLPKGILRSFALLALIFLGFQTSATPKHHHHKEGENLSSEYLKKADSYADSAYFCNVNGRYAQTLRFADSAIFCLNQHYLALRPKGKVLMVSHPTERMAAEIAWYHDSIDTNYAIILDIRNECAVAALALHDWALYQSNNTAYTQLFRETSADNTLANYVRTMQQSENSKTVAVILLVLLLIQLLPTYYFVYYRHVLSYRFTVERINEINKTLLGDMSDAEKLQSIQSVWKKHKGLKTIDPRLDDVVTQIECALKQSVSLQATEAVTIEMAEDELRRAEYENAKLHISNSVLDNCLSTLKHETMYYPSRIRQLIDSNPQDVTALQELVDYYKSLYMMLSMQAMQQVEPHAGYDKMLVAYLFDILKKEGGSTDADIHVEKEDSKYVVYRMAMPKLHLDTQQCRDLFSQQTVNMKFMLCRQIIREMGEVTNLQALGIDAQTEMGRVVVRVVLPKVIVNKQMKVYEQV